MLTIKHISILVLIYVNLAANYGFWKITNSYEATIGFFFITCPLIGLMFLLCLISRKSESGMARKISILGISISLLIFLVVGAYTSFLAIKYHLDNKNYPELSQEEATEVLLNQLNSARQQ